jgi:hypothetical protein
MKKLWFVLLIFGMIFVPHFSAFASPISSPILPKVWNADIDIIDPDTGEIIRTDRYADILNSLVTIDGDISSFVYGSGVVLTNDDEDDYYKVDFNLAVDTDPWYVWNVNLFNSSTKYIRVHTETFSGIFTEPVANSEVSSEMGGLLNDFLGNGIRVAPVNQSNIAVTELYSDSNPSVNLGVDLGNAIELDSSGAVVEGDPSEVTPLFPGYYGYSDAVPVRSGPDPSPDPLWTGFRTTVSFSVSQYDSANFNGRVDIIPVAGPATLPEPTTPEPTSIYLMGFGLLGVLGFAIRQRRRAKGGR